MATYWVCMAMLNLIDTHCHLDFSPLSDDVSKTLRDAAEQHVTQVVVPSVTQQNWYKVHQLSHDYRGVHAAFGLHPMFEHSTENIRELMNALGDYLSQHPCVAVGEFGLDFFMRADGCAASPLSKEAQLILFNTQLDLAKQMALPVILHVRKAHDETLKILRTAKLEVGGIIHAFSGSDQQAQQYIDLGFKLGFGGAITYPNALRKQRQLKQLPVQSIVLETDAPDMLPYFARLDSDTSINNTPANAYGIARVMAEHMDIELHILAKQLVQNTYAVLPLMQS